MQSRAQPKSAERGQTKNASEKLARRSKRGGEHDPAGLPSYGVPLPLCAARLRLHRHHLLSSLHSSRHLPHSAQRREKAGRTGARLTGGCVRGRTPYARTRLQVPADKTSEENRSHRESVRRKEEGYPCSSPVYSIPCTSIGSPGSGVVNRVPRNTYGSRLLPASSSAAARSGSGGGCVLPPPCELASEAKVTTATGTAISSKIFTTSEHSWQGVLANRTTTAPFCISDMARSMHARPAGCTMTFAATIHHSFMYNQPPISLQDQFSAESCLSYVSHALPWVGFVPNPRRPL
eukprot:2601570-Rhodomonas_salina.1